MWGLGQVAPRRGGGEDQRRAVAPGDDLSGVAGIVQAAELLKVLVVENQAVVVEDGQGIPGGGEIQDLLAQGQGGQLLAVQAEGG